MQLGHLRDIAPPELVYFVLGCIIVVIGLLHLNQIITEQNLNSQSAISIQGL